MLLLKKIIVVCIGLMLISALVSPQGVFAQQNIIKNLGDVSIGAGDSLKDPKGGLIEVVVKIIEIALSLVGLLFLSLTLYGGFMWMTAVGSSDKVEKAVDTIKNGIIGVVVVFLSYSIVFFVFSILSEATNPLPY